MTEGSSGVSKTRGQQPVQAKQMKDVRKEVTKEAGHANSVAKGRIGQSAQSTKSMKQHSAKPISF